MWFFLLNRPDCCSCVTSLPHLLFLITSPPRRKLPGLAPSLSAVSWQVGGKPRARYQGGQCRYLAHPMGTAHSFLAELRMNLFPTLCTCLFLVILFCGFSKNNILFLRESIQHDVERTNTKRFRLQMLQACAVLCVCIHIYMVSIYIVVQPGWSQQRSVYVFMKCLKRDKLTAW